MSDSSPLGSQSESGSGHESVVDRLYDAQTAARERRLLTVVATVAGLALATVHWSGLLAGGALVGLCQPTLRRALVAGLGFGLVVLGVVAAQFALAGSLSASLAMGPLLALGVAVPLVAGPLGATARGLLPDAPSRDAEPGE
ncbi:hypothetical protein [Halosimplex salinum]|uniref:hypothetical protein n=1 Tax=Halosimplex salinum TaxID=1710538 RepID=UPI000F47E0D4|nr:hypothetical protein [Halosimplex salinum]